MRGISILMYHQVGEFPPPASHRALYCHVRRFSAQMAYLHRFGYRVLSMDDAVAMLEGRRPIPPRAVVLTFDDGYENFYRHAFPVLLRYRFPAIVYLVADDIGGPARWFGREGRPMPPLMDKRQLLEIAASNIQLGVHGRRHIRLEGLPCTALREETRRAREALEDLLGRPMEHFCYPYGSFDERALEAVREAGFTSAVTCIRGSAYPLEDLHRLPRKAISYGDNLVGVFWKLHAKHKRKGQRGVRK